MYQVDIASLRAGTRSSAWARLPRTVLLLGIVSGLTDVSSEMVSSILPIYLLAHLQFSPLQFGLVDGLYQGVSAIGRLGSGIVADRWRRYKWVAMGGYALSAACKLGLLLASGPAMLASLIAVDRTGKGLRTAPRDAMISRSVEEPDLATAFGVHRAFDTAGVVVGPLAAYLILKGAPDAFDVVFITSFAFAFIGLSVLALLVDDEQESTGSVALSMKALLPSVGGSRFRAIVGIGSLLGFTVVSDAFLYLVLQQHTKNALETLPLYFIGTSIAFLVLAVPVGRLADRIGRARVYLGGHVLVLMLYGIALFGRLDGIGLFVCLALHGAYYAATDGVLPALASGIVPRAVVGSSLAALSTATSVSRLFGSLLIGALWSAFGPSSVLVFGLAGTAAVIAWASLTLLPMDTRRRLEPAE